jgi:hypothetical protein
MRLCVARLLTQHPTLQRPPLLDTSGFVKARDMLLDELTDASHPDPIRLHAMLLMRTSFLDEVYAMLRRQPDPLPQEIAALLVELLIDKDVGLGADTSAVPEEIVAMQRCWPILDPTQRTSLLGDLLSRINRDKLKAANEAHQVSLSNLYGYEATFSDLILSARLQMSDSERALALRVLLVAGLPFREGEAIRLIASENPELRMIGIDAVYHSASAEAGDRLVALYHRLHSEEQRRVGFILQRLGRSPDEAADLAGRLSVMDEGHSAGQLEMVQDQTGALSIAAEGAGSAPDGALAAPSASVASMGHEMSAQERAWLSLIPAPRELPRSLRMQLRFVGASRSHRLVMALINGVIILPWIVSCVAILIAMKGNNICCILFNCIIWSVIYSMFTSWLLSKQPAYKALINAPVIMRRVLSIERGLLSSYVEIEDERGTQWINVPRAQLASHGIQVGGLVPVMRRDDDQIISPLELRTLAITPRGQLTTRLDLYSGFVILCFLGAFALPILFALWL